MPKKQEAAKAKPKNLSDKEKLALLESFILEHFGAQEAEGRRNPAFSRLKVSLGLEPEPVPEGEDEKKAEE